MYFDSIKVQANAGIYGMIDRAEYEVQQHLEHLFELLEFKLLPFGQPNA